MKGVVIILGFLAMVGGQTTNVQQSSAVLPTEVRRSYTVAVTSICVLSWAMNVLVGLYQSNASTLPLNTHVQGCISPPCQIPQLDSLSIEIFFRSPRLIRSMRTHAHVYILGPIGTSYDLGAEAVTCNFIANTYCPLMEDEVIQYRLAMFIESWMAAGTAVTIEFVIRDESDNSPIMCVRMPIRIVPPVNRLAQQTNPSVPFAQRTNSTVPVIVNA